MQQQGGTTQRDGGRGYRFVVPVAFSADPGSHWWIAWVLLAVYAGMSAVLFLMYGLDKRAAEKGRRRIAESTLHLFAVAGGWPGAVVAQRFFRHKTRKQPFRIIFWCTVIVNCLALAWLLMAVGLFGQGGTSP